MNFEENIHNPLHQNTMKQTDRILTLFPLMVFIFEIDTEKFILVENPCVAIVQREANRARLIDFTNKRNSAVLFYL